MSTGALGDVFRLAGTTLEARFEVDRVVAEGGFGVVYHATQAALERPIALKVLKTPPRFDEAGKQQFLAGFAAEAKTIARIAHPNIVQVFDFGVSPMPSGARAAWMALEWLTGTTFEDQLISRRGRGGRPPAECLAILRPVLSALAVVHAGGVAHRDLKPANIMVVPSTGAPTMKLLDFGIAKIMHPDEAPGTGNTQTRSNQIAFSPAYASPEQISNGRSGPWTDVHAMGLILTEMLTDRAALEGSEPALLFQQILDRVRPTPAKYGVMVGPWEVVLRKALSVSSAERYRDAAELLRALDDTVAEASALRVTTSGSIVRPAGLDLPNGSSDTLEAMSTQRAPSSGVTALAPQLSLTTTGSPTSAAEPTTKARQGPRAAAYLVGGALALTTIGTLGWRALVARSHAAESASAAPVDPANAALSPTPSASAVETSPARVSPPPSVSLGEARLEALSADAGTQSPAAPLQSHGPSRAHRVPPVPAAPSATPAPATSPGKLVIE